MVDYFALLEQPRQPWLDQDARKSRYQALAKTTHPDQGNTPPEDAAFAELVEANRVLSDDKLRLLHLLQLEGFDLPREAAVPGPLLHLFPAVNDFALRSDEIERRLHEASNPLSKSLLQTELVSCRTDAAAWTSRLRALIEEGQAECRALNELWRDHLPRLAELYFLFAILAKWLAQLEERKFRLEQM